MIACGPRGALLFMSWLGIRVLPCEEVTIDDPTDRFVGSLVKSGSNVQVCHSHHQLIFYLKAGPSVTSVFLSSICISSYSLLSFKSSFSFFHPRFLTKILYLIYVILNSVFFFCIVQVVLFVPTFF